jgi:hypothetical protein
MEEVVRALILLNSVPPKHARLRHSRTLDSQVSWSLIERLVCLGFKNIMTRVGILSPRLVCGADLLQRGWPIQLLDLAFRRPSLPRRSSQNGTCVQDVVITLIVAEGG